MIVHQFVHHIRRGCCYDEAYPLDVLKLIDLTQDALVHALTLHDLYQEGLPVEEYDRVLAKYEHLISEKFRLLRSSVEDPEAFSKVIADFQKFDPKTKPM
jgi:hypothetical protein